MTSGFLLKSTNDFYMGTQSWRCHSDMGIPCNHNPNRWAKIWQGDAHITRVWEWGCPYHRDSTVTGSTQCGPGSLSPPHRRHTWAEFAVGFRALVFSSSLAFFLSSFFFLLYRAHSRKVWKTSSSCTDHCGQGNTSHRFSAFKKKTDEREIKESRNKKVCHIDTAQENCGR